jgi:CRP-like cAMP-binding protein
MASALLMKLSQCRELGAEDLALLAQATAHRRELAAKEDILRQGDSPSEVHLVVEGFACRYKLMAGGKRAIIAYLLPGDICDLHADLLGRMDHSIGTLQPTIVADISRGQVEALMRGPAIAHALRWSALVDQAILREWLANMGRRPADRQMAHLFCELRVRLAAVGAGATDGFRLPMTQEELADTLGITTVHVNRVLQQLRDAGLIRLAGRQLVIPDIARLESFAEFTPDYLHMRAQTRLERIEHAGVVSGGVRALL